MDKTKAKIQELVPEIMKLVPLKCEVSWQYTHSLNSVSKVERVKKGLFVNYGNGTLRNPLPMNVLFYGNSTVKSIPNPKEEITILGRPITLADVLLAIKTRYVYENGQCSVRWKERNLTIFCGSGFPCQQHNKGIFDLLERWDLTKPYDDQSQETKDFIGQILGVK